MMKVTKEDLVQALLSMSGQDLDNLIREVEDIREKVRDEELRGHWKKVMDAIEEFEEVSGRCVKIISDDDDREYDILGTSVGVFTITEI